MRDERSSPLRERPEPDSLAAIQHSFEAHPQAVRLALKQTLERLVSKLSPEEAGALELVLAEVCNNIVEHGYANHASGTIALSIYPEGESLLCTVGDRGNALPRRCLDAPDRARPCPEELPEGGFGWFLIRDLVQDLHYCRDGNRNLLVFRLPLRQGPTAQVSAPAGR
ncbi:ATP-binding protein [Paenirhodobacter sp.]|uniref:ATP-binding protein n=1 Tax=Paenirhodobacter sp. TaxID=1965326 RepID=UPI003B419068